MFQNSFACRLLFVCASVAFAPSVAAAAAAIVAAVAVLVWASPRGLTSRSVATRGRRRAESP